MPRSNFELPDECWEHVFTFLNQPHYLDTLSLVSKQFLSITNNLLSSLTISYQTLPYLPPLLKRFPLLRSFDLDNFKHDRELHAPLLQISESSLSIHSLRIPSLSANGFRALGKKMKTLKSLTSYNIDFFTIRDLLLISECFPSLEELDISGYKYRNLDNDLKALSLALPKLRKVKISGSYSISDDSLILHRYRDDKFLEEVVLYYGDSICQDGIASETKERPNLTSPLDTSSERQNYSDIIASFVSLRSLTSIDLSFVGISDELLFSIAKAGLPLRKLDICCCYDYSYAGLHCLLSKCQLIQHLDLQQSAFFLKDKHIKELSMFLGNLMCINLSGCEKLTDISFFALTRNCPLLNDITLEGTYIGKNRVVDSLVDIAVNFKVKSLRLFHNERLRDESIKVFAIICPNLELFELSFFRGTSNGVVEVLKRCSKIRHLGLLYHSGELFGMINYQFPKLEVLRLSYSDIDDESLLIISRSCRGLLRLDVEHCRNITTKGVKQVVKRCKQLREINLTSCHGVAANVVDWMVFSRPSLRRIFAPPRFCLSNNKRKRELFLSHGCRVFETEFY